MLAISGDGETTAEMTGCVSETGACTNLRFFKGSVFSSTLSSEELQPLLLLLQLLLLFRIDTGQRLRQEAVSTDNPLAVGVGVMVEKDVTPVITTDARGAV